MNDELIFHVDHSKWKTSSDTGNWNIIMSTTSKNFSHVNGFGI